MAAGDVHLVRDALLEQHLAARSRAYEESTDRWATLDPDFPRRITERFHKRIISELREARHGGTLLLIPFDTGGTDIPFIDLGYRFQDEHSESGFPDLIVDILNRLARVYGAVERKHVEPVGWQEFEATKDPEIATLDEALFEMSHLLAALAAVDGAVVMSSSHWLQGFGGMISGRLPEVRGAEEWPRYVLGAGLSFSRVNLRVSFATEESGLTSIPDVLSANASKSTRGIASGRPIANSRDTQAVRQSGIACRGHSVHRGLLDDRWVIFRVCGL